MTDFFDRLHLAAELVTDLPELTGIVRDPDDDMIMATAQRTQVAYIVTRDKDLLTLMMYEDITIITPAAFMALVRERRPPHQPDTPIP